MRGAWLAGAAALALGCNLVLGLTSEPGLYPSGEAGTDSATPDGGGTPDTGSPPNDGGPTLLVNARVRHIALDDAAVYYTEDLDSVIGRIQKDGTGQVDLVSGVDKTQFFPETIALDDQNVYWASAAGLHTCAKAGCSGTPVDIIDDNADAAVSYSPGALGVDATWVYFVDYPTSNSSAFRKAAKNMAGAKVMTVTPESALCPSVNNMQLVGTYLYFTCDDGRVGRSDATTGTVEVLTAASPPPGADRFVVSGSSVFYGEFLAQATIYEMPITMAAASTPIALSQAYVNGMDVDTTYLYWALVGAGMDNGTGLLVRCPVSGCSNAVSTLAANIDIPTDVKVDAQWVFWTAWGNGLTPHCGLWQMVKPP